MAARHRTTGKTHRVRTTIISVLAVVLVASLGFVGYEYFSLKSGIHTSDILLPTPGATTATSTATATATHPDTNILIMGLDSRVDVNGNPLPADIYAALHAGDQTDGGLNSNVLMLLHIPGDGSKATEISIPRDDQVDLVGCPDNYCTGKIKQAYGLATDQESRRISGDSGLSAQEKLQKARDAGRKAQIQTVETFLDVHVDHFVEVTMVAFYQLAEVVQPITVCVLNDTEDSFSGANFKAGKQTIDSQQALAFVRQRRDNKHPSLNFTDLDRERRQQAFITSLATQLKQAGTLANPIKLNGILNVVKQNMAIDSGLDLLSFAREASQMAGGNVAFYTLPVEGFGTNKRGEDVNIVDVAKVRATVKALLAPQGTGKPTASGTTTGTPTT
ncbi:MAG: LCP family protein, partial [Lapillicoccus sp.]